jgi:hypothetical protein
MACIFHHSQVKSMPCQSLLQEREAPMSTTPSCCWVRHSTVATSTALYLSSVPMRSLHCRARKLAQNDSTYYNHLLNLHHMQRRMAEAAGISQPRSPLTQSHNVATADQSSRRRPNSVTLPYCPWLPAAELAAAAAADRPNFRSYPQ